VGVACKSINFKGGDRLGNFRLGGRIILKLIVTK
jgi:hypothetical protein